MTNYSTILFDLDGTLTDPWEGITKSVQYALDKFGTRVDDIKKLAVFIGPPLIDSFMRFYGFDEAKARKAVDYYREYFSVKGMYENIVYPGMPELLKRLSQSGKLLAVATSKPTVFSRQILKHFGIDRYFQYIIGSELNGIRTAKTEVVECVLSAIPDISKSSTVMVGDREFDIIGARNNGIDSIAVAYGYGSLEELSDAQPTYIACSVSELENLLCV